MKTNRILFSAMLAATFLPLSAACANAQDQPTKHLVFTEKAAYVTGVRTVAAGSDSTIYPNPRGRYALISQSEAAPRENSFILDSPPANPAPSSLSLYDSRTGRTKIVWRGATDTRSAMFGNIVWLSGSDVAICAVVESSTVPLPPSDPGLSVSSLLLVHPTSTGIVTRVLSQVKGFLSISASPKLAVATINEMQFLTDKDGHSSQTSRHFTVDERGRLGADLNLGPQATGGYSWSADGITTWYRERLPSPAPPVPAGATPASTSHWYAFNVQTQVLTPIESAPQPTPPAKPADTNPLRLASGTFTPAAPVGSGQTPSFAKATKFTPLWIIRSDGKTEGHLPAAAVIAPDAQASFLLADDSAVLYVADSAVYAVPLTRMPRPDIDLAYRKLLQQQALSNAKQIGLALMMSAQDNDNKFPDAGGLAGAVATYLNNDSILNNPETDAPGFTLALGGQSFSSISDPANTVLGYLAGPGGRVAIMADGHTHWQENP